MKKRTIELNKEDEEETATIGKLNLN